MVTITKLGSFGSKLAVSSAGTRRSHASPIELTYVGLDMVPTAAPSESEIGVLKEEAISDDETYGTNYDLWRAEL